MTTAVEMASHSQVLMEDKYTVRILTLNRPNQMNALSRNMITRLLQLFLAYEDPRVKLVILKGQGKAFCAGGDVRPVIRDIVQGKWRFGADFFSDQYTLNYVMATYSKIQISIMNGIVMGGGAGVSIHGRFRIATEKTVFAMPETELGLFPDVGASYFLSRLPGFFGEFVGLTGARLDGAEMLACGLATHFVPSTLLLKKAVSICRLDVIDKCFSRRTVEEIISALEREAIKEPDEWISATLRALKKASPASLKISLRSIREGRFQEVGQCLIREYRMRSLQHRVLITQGCRAVVIDKDRKPKWEPRRLEQVTDNMVDQYFKRMDEEEEWEDLKLPPRINLPSSIIAKL
ncbi:hypothetical protein DY000_02030059 [Brassica cretica]|uniref:3-hydroxyisobutyryl-CoA hydrolase n=1 Tax=Brassica cretica TaxID=69181 RepID=A0ABQ7DLE4_BRACR|nr:hypothetical protein DY000_02030059 [Brassica cretica]